jgi:Fe-S oxidoreductase
LAPRELIEAIPGSEFIEMYRCREQSYCCGGGGGGMWLDSVTADHTKERLSENRVKEAIEIGAEVLVVCCPYEVSRFEDAVKSTNNEGKLEVLDIAEILDFCMAGD